MKWILTGGCGFIGTNTTLALLDAGDVVVVVDNLHRPLVDRNLPLLRERGAECIVADIREPEQIEEIWARHRDAGVVLHLAGQVSLAASIVEPRYDFETNAAGTFNVLEATRDLLPGAVFLYSSTNKVYGDLGAVRFEEQATRYVAPDFAAGFPETVPLEFHGGYGCSKGAADQYVLDFARTYAMPTVSLRQSSVYGVHQYATVDQGWVAFFVKAGVLGERFAISGNGKQVRDALHVDDLVDCFRACVSTIDRCAGEAFNIGGGPSNSLSLLELFAILRQRYGMHLDYDEGPPRPGDQKVFVADVRKARQLMAWEPQVSLEAGLDRLVDWTRETFL